MKPKGKIVLKMEPGMNPADVHCTTYQMRNVYRQVATAMLSSNDIMSLLMHHAEALMARTGDRFLDVCCGRCMVLPLLRRNRPGIASYVGVDIMPANQAEARRWSATTNIEGKRFAVNEPGEGDAYYPFPVHLVECDVAQMADPLFKAGLAPFDFIAYTSAVEHMQKDAGAQSIRECFKVLRPGGRFFLTSPNTDALDEKPQYAAHLYEWPQEELLAFCVEAGFKLTDRFGLLAKVEGYRDNIAIDHPALLPVYDRLA
jgi:SAM-dependent methyltransferase